MTTIGCPSMIEQFPGECARQGFSTLATFGVESGDLDRTWLGYRYYRFIPDDSGCPSFAGQSEAELLLIRYMIARLASFPSVLITTGIDLVEYRDQEWINWFSDHLSNLDSCK